MTSRSAFGHEIVYVVVDETTLKRSVLLDSAFWKAVEKSEVAMKDAYSPGTAKKYVTTQLKNSLLATTILKAMCLTLKHSRTEKNLFPFRSC